MCVILAVGQSAPDVSTEEFIKAVEYNSDGLGIAWNHENRVKYKKVIGTQVLEYKDFRPPKPYIMHFRIATIGGVSLELCHPFVVSKDSSLRTEGFASKVLFHNGHWSDWNKWLAITLSGVGKIPNGRFSDSRALAVMMAHYGDKAIHISGASQAQKVVTLDRNGNLKFFGNWTKSGDKIYRSNTLHLNKRMVNWMYDYGGTLSHNNTKSVYTKCKVCNTWHAINTPCVERYSNNIDFCVFCDSSVPVNSVICNDCRLSGLQAPCLGKSCKNDLTVSDSLLTGYCGTCRKAKDFPQKAASEDCIAIFDKARTQIRKEYGYNCFINSYTAVIESFSTVHNYEVTVDVLSSTYGDKVGKATIKRTLKVSCKDGAESIEVTLHNTTHTSDE